MGDKGKEARPYDGALAGYTLTKQVDREEERE